MHPAPSVIIFTVLSGLGFGLLTFLGLGLPGATGWAAFFYFAAGFALAVGGLLAATFHLGNPQRALKAFTQWQTSWLSREAWLSTAALIVLGVYAFAAIFFNASITLLGWLGALLSLATVVATAMIYAQLKTVPRWNHWLTPLHLLTISLAGGAMLAQQAGAATVLLLFAGAVQIFHWVLGDRRFEERGHTIETATGLGDRGKARLFEPPHTGSNYLLKEMAFVVGRKHAQKLRLISFVAMIVLPLVIVVLLPMNPFTAVIATLFYLAGAFASRWLFFAEAQHVVSLYYGASGSNPPYQPSLSR
ncbi:DMSO reductase anchor subunit [Labrenzia sp. EL_208]|uniref:dimethyl sulfoxide reductase anchor subunit family protein n=1 Tax=Roseibium album TaxID=311410 RepID=UPI0018CA14AD|nr:DMSO reductase anchor subunit [Labrenzia sp. EL_132]MBG6199659.1 DMSO reductase anchor subunit [Labrenzia sp. EL_13]MBG6231142.1 DMSO reductase anchor subunit [Labrenzia sp. EL_208]